LIQLRLKENQNQLSYIPFKEEPLLNLQQVFWTLQIVDIISTAEAVKYECIQEANPLLPNQPSYSDLIEHKIKWLFWTPYNINDYGSLSNEEKEQVFVPANWLMLGVVFNNLNLWRQAINDPNCQIR